MKEWNVSLVVTDFEPLREKIEWRRTVMERCESGFEEVDVHIIVPCWVASPKQEYAATTFRSKVRHHPMDYLKHLPPFPSRIPAWPGDMAKADVDGATNRL
jgi:deoxyribodipyrimidine photo-lyase